MATSTRFQPVLDEIAAAMQPLLGQAGTVASYIPALARVDARQFGIALRTCDGEEAAAGDADTPFSIQSVSKLFTLTLAMQAVGDALWERIGREPSGNPFNSLVQLENEQGKPRNPFINAGAIAVADRHLRRLGAAYNWHPTYVRFGPDTQRTSREPVDRQRRLREDDVYTVDLVPA